MSELKEIGIRWEENGELHFSHVYPKYQVDKVIAEKDAEIAELEMKVARAQLVLRLNKPESLYSDLEIMGRLRHKIDVVERRERHHKYKRCLAEAYVEWLKQMALCNYPESILFRRAARREHIWKKLAEIFKEK